MRALTTSKVCSFTLLLTLMAWGCDDDDSSSDVADAGGAGSSGEAGSGGGGEAGSGGGEAGSGGEAGVSSAYYDGPESIALGAEGNQASCATCHSADGSQDGWSGNTLQDIAYRSAFKGGMAPTLLDASNACVTGWMGGEALAAEDAAWVSLEAYLQSISDESVTDPNGLAPEVLADEAAYQAAYEGGDAASGEAVFDKACGRCHADRLNIGGKRASAVSLLAQGPAGYIAQKVRTSGPPPSGSADAEDLTPGPMPFFEEKDLSTQDLKDVIAYLLTQGG